MKIALRMLLKRPAFTAIAIATLAIGIGANTAIFSFVDKTFLNPIPLEGHEQMITIKEGHVERWAMGVSPPLYVAINRHTNIFTDTTAFEPTHLAHNAGEFPEMLWGYEVTPNFFEFMDSAPMLGRTFTPDEGWDESKQRIVLSEKLWELRFNRDPDILGKTIDFAPYLDSPYKPYTVIGVMPNAFQFPNQDRGGGLQLGYWIPSDIKRFYQHGNRRDKKMLYALKNWTMIAKRADDVSEEKADTVLATIAERHKGKGLMKNSEVRLKAEPMKALFASPEILKTIWAVFGAVGFVLLIACFNISNLQLVRAETRQKEFAIRAALGASQWQVTKQLLLESLIIAFTGGALGLAIAYGGVDLITRLMPTGLPRLNTVALDERALLFAGALCLVAMTIFGLAPAWRPLRSRLSAALKDTGQTSHGTGREWVRKFLVASQVAMAVILLTSAGLMIRSVNKLLAVDPGYNPDNLLSMSLYHLGDKNRGLETTEREAWLNTLTEKINAIPGIQQIGIQHQAGRPKLRQPNTLRDIDVAHMFTGTGQHDVLATMGVRYLAGRTFTKADHSANTVIINETMAKKFWPDTDPIGQLVRTADQKKTYEVIGVVADTRAWSYDQPILPAIYEPYSRKEMAGWSQVFVRTANEPSSVITGIRKSVHQFDASLPPVSPSITAHNLLHQTLARRTYMWFLTGFAGVGLALALIGLYGVVAYSVAQRTREFGIRMALGARVADVLKVVLTQGLKVTMMGILIGLAAATSLTNILDHTLFNVSTTDPLVFTIATIAMSAVALLACLIPASKAAKTQPMEALRYE